MYLCGLAAGAEEGYSGEEDDDGIDRMTVAKRGVGQVEGEGEDQGEDGDEEEIGTSIKVETGQADQHGEEGGGIPEEEGARERGIGVEKIGEGRIRAEPGGGNTVEAKLRVEGGTRADEGFGRLPFLVEEGGFAEASVETSLFEAGDAIDVAGSGIEDFVVAGPEFVGEVGTHGDEAVEVDVVADGPGETGEDEDDEGEGKTSGRGCDGSFQG